MLTQNIKFILKNEFFLLSYLKTSVWIGLKIVDMTFVWEYRNNLESSDSDGNEGEPNNWFGRDEACAHMDHSNDANY